MTLLKPSRFPDAKKSTQTFAALIVQAVLQSVESRSFSRLLAHFRVIPEITLQLAPERLSVTFPATSDGTVLLEDAVRLIDAAGREKPGLTVIFDGFAEVLLFGKAATENSALNFQNSGMRSVFSACIRKHSPRISSLSPKAPFTAWLTLLHLNPRAERQRCLPRKITQPRCRRRCPQNRTGTFQHHARPPALHTDTGSCPF